MEGLLRKVHLMNSETVKEAMLVYIEGYASDRARREIRRAFERIGHPTSNIKRLVKDKKEPLNIPIFGKVVDETRYRNMMDTPQIMDAVNNIINTVNMSPVRLNIDQIISSLDTVHAKNLGLASGMAISRHIKSLVGLVLTMAGFCQKTGKAYMQHKTSRIWVPYHTTRTWTTDERIGHFHNCIIGIENQIKSRSEQKDTAKNTYSFV